MPGKREFDYSAIYFKSASVFKRTKHITDKQMDRTIKVIQAEINAHIEKREKIGQEQ